MSQFYIASLKHTHPGHEHIVWWGALFRGYTPVLGDYAGTYCFGYAASMNDGFDCLAVPVDAVKALMAPEPYHKPGHRFYDQRGPVVDNTRDNWDRLIAASLLDGRQYRPEPSVFKGAKRSFAWSPEADEALAPHRAFERACS